MRQLLIFTAQTSANGPYDDEEHVQLYILPLLPKHLRRHYISSLNNDENDISSVNNHVIANANENDTFIKYMSDAFQIMAVAMASKDVHFDIRKNLKWLFQQQQQQQQQQQSQQQHNTIYTSTTTRTSKKNETISTTFTCGTNTMHENGILRMEDIIDILLRIAQNEQDLFDKVANEQGWVFPSTPFDHDFDLVRIMLLDYTCF